MPKLIRNSPAARRGSSSAFCAGVPDSRSTRAVIETSSQSVASEGKRRASSSQNTAAVETSAPLPPYSVGTDSPCQPMRGEALPELARNAARAIHLADARLGQLAVEELAHAVAQDRVLGCRLEVHAVPAPR